MTYPGASVSCGPAKIIGVYHIDNKHKYGDVLVANVACSVPDEGEASLFNTIFNTRYSYNSLEIWVYNPETKKHDIKKEIIRIDQEYAFAGEELFADGRISHPQIASDAVQVADLDSDGDMDIVLRLKKKDRAACQGLEYQGKDEIVAFYNDGHGNFSTTNNKDW